jgi:hypothetical protein
MNQPPKHATILIPKLVGLDKALTELREGGAKVLDFWREGTGWRLKYMLRRPVGR